MKKRGSSSGFSGVVVSFFITFAILHLITHIFVFGTGIPGFLTSGLQLDALNNIRNAISSAGPYSFRILTIEAGIFIVYAAWISVKNFIGNKNSSTEKEVANLGNKEKNTEKEVSNEEIKMSVEDQGDSSEIKTDIDSLYLLLKEKKHLSFDKIEKAFNVNKETVASWAKILESGNLALIYQPKFGDPELWLDEGRK